MLDFNYTSKTKRLIEKEIRLVFAEGRGWRAGGNWRKALKRYRVPVLR